MGKRKTDLERTLAGAMTGGSRSVLMTDAYKFSMGQAGFPMRDETFYLSFRKKGNYVVPFDLAETIGNMLPAPAPSSEASEREYLRSKGYDLTPAMAGALSRGTISVCAIPKGCRVMDTEPIVSVSGPSFLVSWLEPIVVWLHFPIQVATAMARGRKEFDVTCRSEAEIVRLTADALGKKVRVSIKTGGYRSMVRRHMLALMKAAGEKRSSDRLLEVGMRAANCLETHRIALETCREEGLRRTSDVLLARELGMQPAGTSGHEHQQRWLGDVDGFRAMRDMRCGVPGYLFDTYDPVRVGIPSVVKVMREDKSRPGVVRFDSGDKGLQFRLLREAELRHGLSMTYVFMDSITEREVAAFDRAGRAMGVGPERILYGVGGFLIDSPAPHPYGRNRVAAVYKLSRSGARPVMKFSEDGKQSLPGVPVVRRCRKGGRVADEICQLQEIQGRPDREEWNPEDVPSGRRLSPGTSRLIASLVEDRDRQVRDPGC